MIRISTEQLKRIIRYEETFFQYDEIYYDETYKNFELESVYVPTLDDVKTALSNIRKKDPEVEFFGAFWFWPLFELGEYYEVAPFFDKEMRLARSSADKVRLLPITESDMIVTAWAWMYAASIPKDYEEDEDRKLVDEEGFYDLVEEIEIFEENKDKPVTERVFSARQKKMFIRLFADDRIDNANDTELELGRKFVDELAEQGDEDALRIKGFSCYGGNRLYPCDWKASRDCIEKLYEMTDDPSYANTLGYIYYYGRCNEGKPEYEKAFPMFVVSAANGLFEGMYKLGDMFKNGYACKKSPGTALALYMMVRDAAAEWFIKGEDNQFADASLRVGTSFMEGVGVEKDLIQAYRYCLEAVFAAKRRAQNSDFFGDTNVLISAQKTLDEVRSQLPADFWKKYTRLINANIFDDVLTAESHGVITVSELKNGETKFTVTKAQNHKNDQVTPMFVTFADVDYCDLITKISLRAVRARYSHEFENGKKVLYDEVVLNEERNRYDLYYRDEFTGWFGFYELRFYPPKAKKPSGELLRFVSISFTENGREFDYLCDSDDVKVGDKVIVEGYDGETAVTIKRVFSKNESELGLAKERYKKILRKA